jgi:quercetin dioxygenase-like cupin family protein
LGKTIEYLKRVNKELDDIIIARGEGSVEYEMEELRSTIGVGLFYSNDVAIQMAFCEAGIFPEHVHKEIEHIIVVRGSCIFHFEDRQITLHRGDSLRISPNELHSVEILENTKMIGITIPSSPGYPRAKSQVIIDE